MTPTNEEMERAVEHLESVVDEFECGKEMPPHVAEDRNALVVVLTALKQSQAETERWQSAIYEECKAIYPEVDGGGSDSGDELDFTLSEIRQTFTHLIDRHDESQAEVERLRGALDGILNYRIDPAYSVGYHHGFEWARDLAKEALKADETRGSGT